MSIPRPPRTVSRLPSRGPLLCEMLVAAIDVPSLLAVPCTMTVVPGVSWLTVPLVVRLTVGRRVRRDLDDVAGGVLHVDVLAVDELHGADRRAVPAAEARPSAAAGAARTRRAVPAEAGCGTARRARRRSDAELDDLCCERSTSAPPRKTPPRTTSASSTRVSGVVIRVRCTSASSDSSGVISSMSTSGRLRRRRLAVVGARSRSVTVCLPGYS